MTLDEAITFWVMQWGEPKFDGSEFWSAGQYEFMDELRRSLGLDHWDHGSGMPGLSYTWRQFRQRFIEMKNELASNRQPQA